MFAGTLRTGPDGHYVERKSAGGRPVPCRATQGLAAHPLRGQGIFGAEE